jgi:hypothetical protein
MVYGLTETNVGEYHCVRCKKICSADFFLPEIALKSKQPETDSIDHGEGTAQSNSH